MGVFRQFPYTNFHEMNMDEILKILKTLQEEWNTTKTEWASYKDYIDNYFANLDVSEEVLEAMRTMLADGTLTNVIDPVIVNATNEWLNTHITPTTPIVDDSLSISGAAADSKTVGDKFEALTTALEGEMIEIPVDYELSQGFISSSTGEYVENSGYRITDFIPVEEGDYYRITSTGSLSVFILGLYENTSSPAILTNSVKGYSDSTVAQTYYVEIPSGVNYIRACCSYPYLSSLVLHKVNNTSIVAMNNNETLFDSEGGYEIPLTLNNGYIRANDGVLVEDSAYRYTQLIPVREGEHYKIISVGSVSTFIVGLYENNSETANLDISVYGTFSDSDMVRTCDVTIPNNIVNIRACCKYNAISNLKIFKISNIQNMLDEEIKDNIKPLPGLKPSVSFIFDDGHANDTIVKDMFDKRNMKCGFAVYSPINARYKAYHDAGFEILAHASAYPSPENESALETMLATSYNDVVTSIGECHGFVTPSSSMTEYYRPLVNKYFDYGYTISKGNIYRPIDAIMHPVQPSYSLWRTSLEGITVAEATAIIDYAIATNSFICFYAHTANIGNTWETTTLNSILAYCGSHNIEVLTPYESVNKALSYKANESKFDPYFFDVKTSWSVGAIMASTGAIDANQTGYRYSDEIPVKFNDVIKIRTMGSNSVYACAIYKTGETNADATLSIKGDNSQLKEFYVVIMDNTVDRIRISANNRLPKYTYRIQKLVK